VRQMLPVLFAGILTASVSAAAEPIGKTVADLLAKGYSVVGVLAVDDWQEAVAADAVREIYLGRDEELMLCYVQIYANSGPNEDLVTANGNCYDVVKG